MIFLQLSQKITAKNKIAEKTLSIIIIVYNPNCTKALSKAYLTSMIILPTYFGITVKTTNTE